MTGVQTCALPILGRYDPAALFFSGLCQPFDARLMVCIAPAERDTLAAHALAHMLWRPNASASALAAWAWARAHDKDASFELRIGACEQLLWQGRSAEALAFIEGDDTGAAVALRATEAAMRRDHAKARALYTQAIDALRGTERRKVGWIPYASAWLHVAAHIVAGDPASLEEARRIARAEMRLAGHEGASRWQRFEDVANERLGDREAASRDVVLNRLSGLPGLIIIETSAWLKRRANSAGIAHVMRCGEEFTAAGYHWAARECTAAAQVLAGKTPQGDLAATLAAAHASEQTWRRALAAISALAEVKRNDGGGDTRIAWIVSMKRDTVTGITPWEQKRGPRGWNKGKRAAFTRFARQEQLSAHDARASQAIERYGTSYDVNIDRVLPALVGHPLVFFEDDLDTAVELVTGEPEITVTRGHGGKNGKGPMRVSLNPDIRALTAEPHFFGYEQAVHARARDRVLLVKETATRARDPRHRRAPARRGAGGRIAGGAGGRRGGTLASH